MVARVVHPGVPESQLRFQGPAKPETPHPFDRSLHDRGSSGSQLEECLDSGFSVSSTTSRLRKWVKGGEGGGRRGASCSSRTAFVQSSLQVRLCCIKLLTCVAMRFFGLIETEKNTAHGPLKP